MERLDGAPPPPVETAPPPLLEGGASASNSSGIQGGPPLPDSGQGGFSIENLRGKKVNLGTTILQYEGCSFGSEASRPQELSPNHFQEWEEAQLSELAAEAVFDEEELEGLAEGLCKRRFLVITGEEEVGKGTLALLLAARIRLRREGHLCPVLYSSGLSTDVAVSLERLSERDGSCSGRLLILRDAFASQNPDLLRIPRELDARQFARLQQRLEASNTFLLLTSDRSRLPGAEAEPRLRRLEVLHEVRGPGHELLLQDLHKKAQRLGLSCSEEGAREKLSQVVSASGKRIVEELRTVPRIERFVSFYLLEVAEERLALEEALARARNRETWLLTELADDPEVWAFALTLVLAQPLPCPEGVPWYPFYRLWRELCGHFRRELRLPRERRAASDLVVNRELLDRVRAQVRRTSYPGADTVQFHPSIDPSALWEALLGPGRSLVSSLVPLLRSLAEDGELALREVAAQALGRIGRLDPLHLAFPLINVWSDSDGPFRHHVALGRLLQGVFSESEAEYREGCLGQLRRVSLFRSGKDAWPGAVALREIGRLDLPLAIKELVDLLGRGLRDRPGHVSQQDREHLRIYEGARRVLEDEKGWSREEEDRIHDALEIATPTLFSDDEQYVLAAVQYALVGLCFSRGPIRVLDEVRHSLQERAGGKLSPLLTLLLLRTDGIADILDRSKTSVPAPESPAATVPIHDVLIFASFEDGALERLWQVLEAVFRGADAFPGLIARNLRARFALLLKSWARDAVQLPLMQEVCARLFAGLLASSDRELKDMVFQMLQRDQDFTREGSKQGALATEALVCRSVSRERLIA